MSERVLTDEQFWAMWEQWKRQRIAAGDWPPDPDILTGKLDDPARIRAWMATGKWDPDGAE